MWVAGCAVFIGGSSGESSRSSVTDGGIGHVLLGMYLPTTTGGFGSGPERGRWLHRTTRKAPSMTAQLTAPPIPALDVETPAPPTAPATPPPPKDRRLRRPVWNRFTALQLLVMALATIAPLVIVGTVSAAMVGLISLETMLSVALAAAENPGMIVFGAMFLASPIQWLTGRSQVRVRSGIHGAEFRNAGFNHNP